MAYDDRISVLPGSAIHSILCRLPIRDAVRTMILAKSWRYRWASVPQLAFGSSFFMDCTDSSIPNIINDILLMHTGHVYQFILEIPVKFSAAITSCLYKWVFYLSQRSIQDLRIIKYTEASQMPYVLFCCPELRRLDIRCFSLTIPSNFSGFNNLIHLYLKSIEFVGLGSFQKFISGCPALEWLCLSNCVGCEFITVSCPALRFLCIKEIPNMKSISFGNANNLTDLTFKISSTDNLPHLMPDSVPSLKRLTLEVVNFHKHEELLYIASLLGLSPNLVEVVIKCYNFAVPPLVDYSSRHCFSKLKKVHMMTFEMTFEKLSKHAVDLVQFILERSPALEILIFNTGSSIKHSHRLLTIAEDLLQPERASPKAKLEFLHCRCFF